MLLILTNPLRVRSNRIPSIADRKFQIHSWSIASVPALSSSISLRWRMWLQSQRQLVFKNWQPDGPCIWRTIHHGTVVNRNISVYIDYVDQRAETTLRGQFSRNIAPTCNYRTKHMTCSLSNTINMLLKKHLLLLSKLKTVVLIRIFCGIHDYLLRILWIESSYEQHLFEIEILCKFVVYVLRKLCYFEPHLHRLEAFLLWKVWQLLNVYQFTRLVYIHAEEVKLFSEFALDL